LVSSKVSHVPAEAISPDPFVSLLLFDDLSPNPYAASWGPVLQIPFVLHFSIFDSSPRLDFSLWPLLTCPFGHQHIILCSLLLVTRSLNPPRTPLLLQSRFAGSCHHFPLSSSRPTLLFLHSLLFPMAPFPTSSTLRSCAARLDAPYQPGPPEVLFACKSPPLHFLYRSFVAPPLLGAKSRQPLCAECRLYERFVSSPLQPFPPPNSSTPPFLATLLPP